VLVILAPAELPDVASISVIIALLTLESSPEAMDVGNGS
jgi:hypothetical protein